MGRLVTTTGIHPWTDASVSSGPIVRTAASAIVVTDGVVRAGRLRHSHIDGLAPSDGIVRELHSTRRKDESISLSDGFVKTVYGAYLLTNTRSIRAWPRPNGLLDSRYPDGVDGFQPNMSITPMLGTGILDSRFRYGQPDWTVGDTIVVADGFIKSIIGSTGLDKNLQIVPVSYSGVLDSRYPDGFTPLLPDIAAPYPPPSLDASVIGGNNVSLWWSAASDQVVEGRITSGVSQYDVRRNGSHLDYTSDLDYSDTPPEGAHYYNVRAIDGADNVSADSETVNVNISTGPGDVLSNATLATMGYISITAAPYSADPSGVTDATTRIQAAIDYANANHYTVWAPSGTYRISDTLRCYRWQRNVSGSPPGDNHSLHGATYPSRPVFKLAPNASRFNNAGAPRPMIAFQLWRSISSLYNGQAIPTNLTFNPYDGPGATWGPLSANNFQQVFHNIDLDANRNPGADGIMFQVAQGAFCGNTRIDVTSAGRGIIGGSGRGSPLVNAEIVGGRFGLSAADPYAGTISCAGIMAVGLRCYGQTEANIELGDFIPMTICGFHFTRSTSGPSVMGLSASGTCDKLVCLIDGTIETTGGVAVDNTVAKSMYLRNVWMRGTSQLIKVGNTTYSGSGTWKRVHEHCANDMSGTVINAGAAPTGSRTMAHFGVLNGTSVRSVILANSIQSTLDSAPVDLLTRHLAAIPTPDGDSYILLPAPGTGNSVNSINAAITSAAYAGHNRVMARRGTYYVAGTINLQPHTKLMGTGLMRTTIYTHDSWQPAAGNPYIIETADSIAGTAFVSHLTITARTLPLQYNRFNHFHWRTGKYSGTYGLETGHEYINPDTPTPSRQVYVFHGNGGGRHYGPEKNGRGFSGEDGRVVLVQSTTQPLHLYGAQFEIGKGDATLIEGYDPWSNCEIRNAANVRVYCMKREGSAPSVTVNDAQNVALYGGGQMLGNDMDLGYFGAIGSSNNVLCAMIYPQTFGATAANYTLREDLEATAPIGVGWPNGLTLYKRGTLDDEAVRII